MYDLSGQFSGDLEQDLAQAEEIKQKREKRFAEQADKIIEMADTEGWKILKRFIIDLKKGYHCSPHIYSQNPEAAHSHSGAIYALQEVLDKVQECLNFNNEQL